MCAHCTSRSYNVPHRSSDPMFRSTPRANARLPSLRFGEILSTDISRLVLSRSEIIKSQSRNLPCGVSYSPGDFRFKSLANKSLHRDVDHVQYQSYRSRILVSLIPVLVSYPSPFQYRYTLPSTLGMKVVRHCTGGLSKLRVLFVDLMNRITGTRPLLVLRARHHVLLLGVFQVWPAGVPAF
jgi:hypothetical protein